MSGENDKMAEKTPRTSSDRAASDKSDVETHSATGLDRTLSSRHLQFVAIGGTIGTGLFIGTGGALATAGPVSLLIAFIFVGTVVYSVMTALGEMAAYIPVTGAFTVYASRFVDPTVGFSMGWIYFWCWVVTYALELTVAGLIIQYWPGASHISIGVWVAIFWVIFTAVNFLPVKSLGELEMYLSSIKVITIIGFIIFSICVNAGVGDTGYIGFSHWKDPGAFNTHLVEGATGKFVGFWAVLITAGFSYQGAELVAVGAGETANPRKTIPTAIRRTFWGILILFVATVFFIGLNVPYTNKALQAGGNNATASPLVITAQLAGVKVLPDIINAVLLTAVLSAALSNVYSSSRILVAIAEEGHGPRFLTKTNRWGTPYWSVFLSALVGLLGFLNLSQSGEVVFNWLLNLTAVAGFIAWALINLCHIKFMKALQVQNIPRKNLPYVAPGQPWLSYYGLFFNVLILLTQGFTVFIEWNTSDFFASYISVILFVVLYVGHKIWYRTKLVPAAEVDLSTGCVDYPQVGARGSSAVMEEV